MAANIAWPAREVLENRPAGRFGQYGEVVIDLVFDATSAEPVSEARPVKPPQASLRRIVSSISVPRAFAYDRSVPMTANPALPNTRNEPTLSLAARA